MPLTALLGRDTEVKALRAGCQIPLDDSLRSSDRGESARQVWRSELARAVVDEGACRVLFVGLAAVQDSAFLAPAIAEALGVFDDVALDLAETRADCVQGSAFALVYTLVPLAAAAALKGDHA